MKVNVIQLSEVTFRSRWRWWSNWIDIAMFDYQSTAWLIQMRVSRTNQKSFKSVRVTGPVYRQVTASTVGDLMPMTRDENRK